MHFLSDDTRASLASLADAGGVVPDALVRLRSIRSLIAANMGALDDQLPQIADAAQLKPAATKWRWQGSDEQIAERHDAGRRRAARPSSVPSDLPGYSVADAAKKLGVTAQAIYLQVSRGKLRAESVELPDGRRYKRVFLEK